jgi:hypothetical protein
MATVTLTFVEVELPIVDKNIFIGVEIGGVPIVFSEFFEELRTLNGTVTAPVLETDADVIAANFIIAWNLDYINSGGLNNTVAIEGATANEVIINFINPSWQITAVTGTSVIDGNVTYVISNPTPEDDASVSIESYEAYVADPCAQALANIAVTGGNGLYNVYLKPSMTLVVDGLASPFQLQDLRGVSSAYRITDTLGFEIAFDFIVGMPNIVSEKKIDIAVTNLSAGATVSITIDFISDSILPYTYSLTGSGYQSSNVFTGLAPGDYTIYVKDAFLCVETKDFTVDGVTEITETIFRISEINALRWAIIDSNKKNHKNTLSCFELKKLTYPYIHKYLATDVMITQFKTNAQYINVYAIEANGDETALGALQMTENIGLDAKSTSTYFSLGEGRSAIYFGEVDILDPITDVFIETTDFGFTLPEWANTVGNYVTIEGIGQVPIDSIGYSDFYNSFVIEFDIAYTGVAVERDLSAIYNLQPYEVYESTADMSVLPELFNIIIEVGTDSDNIDFTYISEKIKRVVDSDKLIEIFYSDDENKGDMVYQTEIVHKMLLEGAVDYVGEQETEGYDGDTNFFVTDNTVYDSQKFVFYRLSSEMAHKLRLVMTHLYLQINGLNYKIAEIPEIKTDINNNSKTFSVILKRGGQEFLTDDQEIIEVGSRASADAEAKAGAIEAAKGKSLILWHKS